MLHANRYACTQGKSGQVTKSVSQLLREAFAVSHNKNKVYIQFAHRSLSFVCKAFKRPLAKWSRDAEKSTQLRLIKRGETISARVAKNRSPPHETHPRLHCAGNNLRDRCKTWDGQTVEYFQARRSFPPASNIKKANDCHEPSRFFS